jgi:hypothetical protein
MLRRFAFVVPVALVLFVVAGCEQEAPIALPTAKSTAATTGPIGDAELAKLVDRAIQETADRVLDVDVNNAWQVVHGILAYGPKLQMRVKGSNVSALEWLFAGNVMNGWNLYPGDHGLEAELVPGSSSAQGHPDQWVGYLSQCGVGLDDKITVPVGNEKRTFTMRDMLEQAKWSLRDGQEATWTLMAFAAYSSPEYLPLDGEWTARDGTKWTFEKIVDMEATAGIQGAACGGSHRLYALAEALALYQKTGKPMTGGWEKAQNLLADSLRAAHEYQQPDGGFSTNMFFRSGMTPDVDARINSTGHVFEVLAYALSDEELRSPWFTRAAQYLCKKIDDAKSIPVSCGGLYHGAHGLMIYRDRRFGKQAMPAAK